MSSRFDFVPHWPAMTAPRARTQKRAGRVSLFRGKVRAPVSITLTRDHHAKLRKAMARLGLTRADTIALLIEQHADTIQITSPRSERR